MTSLKKRNWKNSIFEEKERFCRKGRNRKIEEKMGIGNIKEKYYIKSCKIKSQEEDKLVAKGECNKNVKIQRATVNWGKGK